MSEAARQAHITLHDGIPPDPEDMNDNRADWAGLAIHKFAQTTGMDEANEDNDTILSDMLTDILHWCDRNKVDFDECLSVARSNYVDETTLPT
jgi:hypothetical protein